MAWALLSRLKPMQRVVPTPLKAKRKLCQHHACRNTASKSAQCGYHAQPYIGDAGTIWRKIRELRSRNMRTSWARGAFKTPGGASGQVCAR